MPKRSMRELAVGMVSELMSEVKKIEGGAGEGRLCSRFEDIESAVAKQIRRLSRSLQERIMGDLVAQEEKGLGNSVRCSECGSVMRFKGRSARTVLTRNGAMGFDRRVYSCLGCGRGWAPVEEGLGIPAGRWSCCVEEWMSLTGMTWSFSKASAMVKRMTGLPISSTSIRGRAEHHGGEIARRYEEGTLHRDWDYEKEDGRLYGMVDGAMAHIREEGWKEIRYSLYQDAAGEQKHCRGWFADSKECGRRLRAEAARLGASRARELVFMADTADWIWAEVSANLPRATQVADFYHMSSHVHGCAEAIYPSEEAKRKAWAGELLHTMKHEGAKAGLRWIKRRRPPTKKGSAALMDLHKYIEKNAERMDYPRYLAAGIPIGSGPIESLCKSVNTQRLKLPGARWRKQNAEAIAELRCLFLSQHWDAYWQAEKTENARIAA